jgi:hypothetical protein
MLVIIIKVNVHIESLSLNSVSEWCIAQEFRSTINGALKQREQMQKAVKQKIILFAVF